MRSRNGGETVVSYNATTFRSSDGKLKGVFVAARDITTQKLPEAQIRDQNHALTEATAFLNNVLESSTEYSIIDMDLQRLLVEFQQLDASALLFASGDPVRSLGAHDSVSKGALLHDREEHRHQYQDVNRRGDHSADDWRRDGLHHVGADPALQ
jgi:hypothetical protein